MIVPYADLKAQYAALREEVLAALDRWATQDPQQAFRWAAKCPDRTLQDQGIARVLNVYAEVSPVAAGVAVDQLPPDPVRESAIGSYAQTACLWNPEAATQMAFKTADLEAREQRVESCFRLWLAWDPNSAKRWLAATDFPEETRQRWLSEIPTPAF